MSLPLPLTVEFSIPFEKLEMTPELIFSGMGYQDDDAPEFIKPIVHDLFPRVAQLAQAKAGFTILHPDSVRFEADKIFLDTVTLNSYYIITKRLRKADTAALFAATAGPNIEALSKETIDEGDMMTGYCIDTFGSLIAERAADTVERAVEEHASALEMSITNRYSPGYCNWSVADQHGLFSFFPKEFCGITLSESGLMRPLKSISGIIGIGKNVRREEYECSLCNLEYCFRRKHK